MTPNTSVESSIGSLLLIYLETLTYKVLPSFQGTFYPFKFIYKLDSSEGR